VDLLKQEEKLLQEEMICQGHSACPGCGAALAVRYLTRAIGPNLAIALTASCWSIIAASPPLATLKCPVLHCPFPSAGAVGSGLRHGLNARGMYDTTVVILAGDGGTFDIGLQAMSGAAQRNEDVIFVCYDNEAYMNTGMQTSSATPFGARTNTAPYPLFKVGQKKDIMQIMASHGIPYAATATVAYPGDLEQKIRTARDIRGFRFIHILCPCPPGWGTEAADTILLSRLAVTSGAFPLYEVRDGCRWKLNRIEGIKKSLLKDYLIRQRRFKDIDRDRLRILQEEVDRDWEFLIEKERLSDRDDHQD